MTNVACRRDEGVAEHGGANPTAQLLYPFLKVPLVRNDHLFCFIEWSLWWGLLRILVVFIGSHILTCSHVQKMCIRHICFLKNSNRVCNAASKTLRRKTRHAEGAAGALVRHEGYTCTGLKPCNNLLILRPFQTHCCG